jgi:hypothetical protein
MCLKKRPSMRLLIFIFPIILIACGDSKTKPVKSPGNLTKEHSKDTLTNKSVQMKDFSNEGGSSIKVGSDQTQITNVTYSIENLYIDDKLENYIVKKTQNTITTPEQEKIDSKITLDILALNDGHLVRTISKSAVSVLFSTQFIQTYNNGGCLDEMAGELSSLSGETFLRSGYKYQTVEIPNAQIHLYFGFSCAARDESKLILGELYFAQALPIITQGKGNYYSLAYKTVSRIIFKAQTKEVFNSIEQSSPDMTLLKHTDKDVLENSDEKQTLQLWSYDKVKSLSGVNFPGLEIKFFKEGSGSSTIIKIPIKDGLPFGDNLAGRTIYIDK